MSELPDLSAYGYDVVELIGAGATSHVYKAHQRDVDNRLVAVKLFHPGTIDPAISSGREKQAAAGIPDHPHISSLFDVVVDGQTVFAVSAFLGGSPPEPPVEPARVADIGAKLASALSAAHAAHIIHSDIKPGNVLWTSDGEPILGDFGAARILDRSSYRHDVGFSPSWAPVSIKTDGATRASDVWSLGATLGYYLIGKRPGETDWAEFADPKWRALLQRAMPDEFDASTPGLEAGQFATELRALLQGEPETEFVPGMEPPHPFGEEQPVADDNASSSRRLGWLVPLVILAAIVGLLSFFQPWVSDDERPEPVAVSETTTSTSEVEAAATTQSSVAAEPVSTEESSPPVDSTTTTTVDEPVVQLPAFSGVFASDRTGNSDLFELADGNLSPLLVRDSDDTAPSYSPDRTQYVFASIDNGVRSVFLANADGTGVTQLSTGSEATSPTWSPGGSTIVWAARPNNNWDLFSYDLATGVAVPLTTSTSDDVDPSFSSDGLTVVFRSDRTGNGDIYSVEVGTGAISRLTDDGAVESTPAVSPSGAIAFARRVGNDSEIFVIEQGGEVPQRVTTREGFDGWPTFNGETLFWVASSGSTSWIEREDGARFAESAGTISEPEQRSAGPK